jgi:hypothetical protein
MNGKIEVNKNSLKQISFNTDSQEIIENNQKTIAFTTANLKF